jgi:hypothetical protein
LKFYQNVLHAYGQSAFVDECVYTNPPDGGPVRITDICDDSEPYNASYTSGTETLRATLIDIDETESEVTVTVGANSDTVPVNGWIEITESPFRLVQVRLQATDDVTLGNDVWENTMLVNAGAPRGGTMNSGAFVVPLGGFDLDGVGSKSGTHYAVDLPPLGVATGTLSTSSFTMSYQYSESPGSVSLSLQGSVVSRPPVAAFSVGTPSGCSVSVDGTASTDPDGSSTIERWHWYVNGYPAGEGSTETVSLRPNTNLVELVVADTIGLVSATRASHVVEASSCAP